MVSFSFTRKNLRMTKRGRQKTPEMWEELIEEWEKSGLQKIVYCKEKNISKTNFRFWMQRLRSSLIGKQSRDAIKKWEAIIEDWKKSGLNKHAYCLQNELSHSFYRWEKKLNPSAPREDLHMVAVKKWTEIIEDWEKSACSAYVYCKKKGLIVTAFYYWRRRLNPFEYSRRKKERPIPYEPTLQELLMPATLSRPLSIKDSSPPQRLEITLSQGHSLTLEGYFDQRQLTSILTPLLKREL
jgi:hypothetical protein